ncbi:MAG: shikimate dehydrogenase [bacterium]
MQPDAKTKMTGLLGYPVEHSLSPEMHNAAFDVLGLNFCYIAFAVHPASLTRAIEGVRAMNFRGVNVTVPHKEQVLLMLDAVDEEASFIGAVNTVVNDNGHLKGFNTDGRGFMRSLTESGIDPRGKNVFILGAGGASRAVSYYLAKTADSLCLFDLDKQKAAHLLSDLKTLNPRVSFAEEKEKIYTSDIVINATPLGLKPDDPLPLDPDRLFPGQAVIDLIYRDTPLMQSSREKGCRTMNGLGMLLWQGALAFELWTGISAPVETMRTALLTGFARTSG